MQTLIVGLPSLNEADNIRDLTQNVDAGCKKYFPNCRCILLNVDCQSPDGTREALVFGPNSPPFPFGKRKPSISTIFRPRPPTQGLTSPDHWKVMNLGILT